MTTEQRSPVAPIGFPLMPELDKALAWVDKAEEDHELALMAIRRRKHPLPGGACYHSQQCVEKYLRRGGGAGGSPRGSGCDENSAPLRAEQVGITGVRE